jgi:hypothetical protein
MLLPAQKAHAKKVPFVVKNMKKSHVPREAEPWKKSESGHDAKAAKGLMR